MSIVKLINQTRTLQGVRSSIPSRTAVVVQDALAIELNALNQLKGTVISVKLGGIMAEVAVDVGGQEMVSARRHG
jgi:hypothetical protein